jgi:hypothetical protein
MTHKAKLQLGTGCSIPAQCNHTRQNVHRLAVVDSPSKCVRNIQEKKSRPSDSSRNHPKTDGALLYID